MQLVIRLHLDEIRTVIKNLETAESVSATTFTLLALATCFK
jgi:hypothetical protein